MRLSKDIQQDVSDYKRFLHRSARMFQQSLLKFRICTREPCRLLDRCPTPAKVRERDCHQGDHSGHRKRAVRDLGQR